MDIPYGKYAHRINIFHAKYLKIIVVSRRILFLHNIMHRVNKRFSDGIDAKLDHEM